jgi:leucine dehydrogenase
VVSQCIQYFNLKFASRSKIMYICRKEKQLSINRSTMNQIVSSMTDERQIDLFEKLAAQNYEQIVFCQDKDTGLKAIIAIHNTVLGPGLGGTRMYHYNNEQEAIVDVLRLSRGMTYKASISKLNLGGAKAVIIGNPETDKSEAFFRRFGRFVESLAGRYITAEDVGTTTKDMEYVNMETDFVVGLPENLGGGGDPSPVTAYGTYLGIRACAGEVYGNESLAGKKILVEGVGKVGMHLVKYLAKENAKVLIADVNQKALEKVSKEYGATVVPVQEIFDADMDVYSPCALGATVNDESIEKLKCAIIAGAANNQLQDENIHAHKLMDKGICYAPDYLINAGGLINVYTEYHGYNEKTAMAKTETIFDTTQNIIRKSKAEGITTHEAANKLAEERINAIGSVQMNY